MYKIKLLTLNKEEVEKKIQLCKSKRRINFVQLKENKIYDDYNINYIDKNKEYLEDNEYFEKIIYQHQDYHLDIKKEFVNNFTYMNDFFNIK